MVGLLPLDHRRASSHVEHFCVGFKCAVYYAVWPSSRNSERVAFFCRGVSGDGGGFSLPADAARLAEDNFGIGLLPPGVGVDARGLLPLPVALFNPSLGMSGDGGPTSTSGGAMLRLDPPSNPQAVCDGRSTPDGVGPSDVHGRPSHGFVFGKPLQDERATVKGKRPYATIVP